jgi:hypothetical protein
VDEVSEAAELREQAISLMQRLLRGRAVQNAMYQGKERRIELIRELRGGEEGGGGARMMNEGGDGRSGDGSALQSTKIRESAIDTIAGETTSALLDFMAKDLVRKEEKDRLQAMASEADKERRRREVIEGGVRQGEELVRDREDEAYRQVMRMHHQAAGSYVQEIIDQALESIVQDAITKLTSGITIPEGVKAKEMVAGFLEASAQAVSGEAEERERDERFAVAARATVDSVL